MAKQIIFDEAARKKLKSGIDQITNAVKVTLGPRARHVVLDKGFGAPEVCDDGVTITKEIELKDKVENLGAENIKEVAEKTNDVAGDGTTTAVVLSKALIEEGLKNVAAGADPLSLKRGIEKGLAIVVDNLKKMAKPISKQEEIAQVATISALNPEIGNMIAEVFSEVGKDGVITVEESKKFGLEKEIVKGLQFDRGYLSPYMITNAERMESVLEDPYILVTDKKISALTEIVPIMEKIVQTGNKELVIIAEEVEGEALATLVVNKLRGVFNALAIKAPGFGDRRKEMLQDISIVTGAQLISEELGLKLENVELKQLGRARKIVSEKEKTTIIDGQGDKKEIDKRVQQIRSEITHTESDFDKEKLQERLAKLAGGVAVIKVGAATEVEQKAKQRKTEDALNATRAAIEEGVLPGGGTALLRCIGALENNDLTGDEKTGLSIIKKALEAPIKQIAENAGMDGAIVVQEVKSKDGNYGFNAQDLNYGDLIALGIVDPTKVVRSALQHAASAAAMLLTTEVVIVDEPDDGKKTDMSSGMPGMGGY